MKLNKLVIVSSFMVFLFIAISCSKKEDQPDYYVNTPIAGFTYTGNDGPAPVTIQFYNTSQYADEFEWDFGDGTSSTERDPKHVYHNATNDTKNFLVVLKATESSTDLFQRKSKTIAVQPGS